jgi:hypothetical protein
MHRSGTSLVSSLLQSGGLDIGQRLLGARAGNVKGHFEDLDFVRFHVQVLKSLRLPTSGYTLEQSLPVRGPHVLQARTLIEDRRRRRVSWGWKDPRTTLFLDFWQQMLPESDFLLLYRCPWDVVDSMLRRGDEEFRGDCSSAVRIWIHYNRLLLDFHDRFPERCLCMSGYRAAQSPLLLREALARKFGLELSPLTDLYESCLLHRVGAARRAALLQHHFDEAAELYEQLNARASQKLINGVSLADAPTPLHSTED